MITFVHPILSGVGSENPRHIIVGLHMLSPQSADSFCWTHLLHALNLALQQSPNTTDLFLVAKKNSSANITIEKLKNDVKYDVSRWLFQTFCVVFFSTSVFTSGKSSNFDLHILFWTGLKPPNLGVFIVPWDQGPGPPFPAPAAAYLFRLVGIYDSKWVDPTKMELTNTW